MAELDHASWHDCLARPGQLRFASMGVSTGARLSLIFDADDTLWDSNIHFLEAEQAFETAIGAAGIAADGLQIRASLRRSEVEIIGSHGYGRMPYVLALHRAAEELAPSDLLGRLRAEIAQIGEHLINRHCELLPGVEPTLTELATRHRLLLFTKGQPAEQMGKLERSGLAPLFSKVTVPKEKDAPAYRRLIAQEHLEPSRTFMIGNSPRSDINPALKAGLRAVYIPHPHTWELEHEELDLEDERVIALSSFSHLLEVF